jgi:SpoVK/Ycf46/Vps4 family AAA+-type ATPase
MDGMKSHSATNPIVIAATNRPYDIDEGVLRRLGRRVMVDIPDEVARNNIMSILLKGELVSDDADIPELVSKTHGYTGSDLRDLVRQAAISAVREIRDCRANGRKISGPQTRSANGSSYRRVLRKAHFIRAMQEVHASPNKEAVNKIRDFHNKYGNTAQRFDLDDEQPEVINKGKDRVDV